MMAKTGKKASGRGKKRGSLPKILQNEPVLPESCRLYWKAFCDLTTCRPAGGGNIPWTVVGDWADEHGLDEGQRFVLREVVDRVDREYLSYSARKAETEAAARAAAAKAGGR